MIRTEETIVIERPIEDVFWYLADLRNDMAWRSELRDIRQKSVSSRGRGAKYEQRLAWAGMEADTEVEIVEFRPSTRITYEGTSGTLHARGDYELDTQAAGTRLHVISEIELGGDLATAEDEIGEAVRRQGEEDLRHLKDILESR